MISRLVVAAVCVFLLAQVSAHWYVTRDGASYLSIARSLAHGGVPTNLGEAQLFFAPGYSVFIAPCFWWDDRPLLLVSLVNAGLAIAYFLTSRSWLARHAAADATLVAAACAVNASVGILFRRTLSEALFMPLLMVTVFWLERVRVQSVGRISPGSALAAGAATAFLCLTRQAGFTLLPGFAIALGWMAHRGELRWRRALGLVAIVAVPAVLTVLALSAYERSVSDDDALTYADYFSADDESPLARVAAGLRLRVSEVGRIALPGMFKAAPDASASGWINFLLYSLTCLAVVYGATRMLRHGADTLICATPFYLLLYIVWPFDEGIRFLAPLAPVWFVALYHALPDHQPLRHRAAWLSLAAHGIVAAGYWLSNDLPEARGDNAHWPAIDRLAAAIDPGAGRVAWQATHRDHERVMLQLALDRRVVAMADPESIDSEFAWLITSDTARPPSDFGKITTAGDFVLWRRGIP